MNAIDHWRRLARAGALLGCGLALGACAGSVERCPRPLGHPALTPARAAVDPRVAGQYVTWGGTLLATRHRADATELEIVAQPLGACARPRPGRASVGRFVALYPDYLATAALRLGQPLTVTGRIGAAHPDQGAGSALPVAWLHEARVRAWPLPPSPEWRPGIGIDVGIGSDGWRGGRVGIRF